MLVESEAIKVSHQGSLTSFVCSKPQKELVSRPSGGGAALLAAVLNTPVKDVATVSPSQCSQKFTPLPHRDKGPKDRGTGGHYRAHSLDSRATHTSDLSSTLV